jgi:hypothetical protein
VFIGHRSSRERSSVFCSSRERSSPTTLGFRATARFRVEVQDHTEDEHDQAEQCAEHDDCAHRYPFRQTLSFTINSGHYYNRKVKDDYRECPCPSDVRL